ncbi:hypothetical protein AV530_012668 [Patagioenas fasciata monilis]|uniref:Uncharacterized protein n=1 Tax=Patagioenas fasciata monilis TaxID=372326 RepID=A0A1V4JBV8_PATFA|nr:hypothetical protein AV530_012668 [Patagioenas fasciata monilis]
MQLSVGCFVLGRPYGNKTLPRDTDSFSLLHQAAKNPTKCDCFYDWRNKFQCLRSSSVPVCRRDLKIILCLSLPQTANSKMTVR